MAQVCTGALYLILVAAHTVVISSLEILINILRVRLSQFINIPKQLTQSGLKYISQITPAVVRAVYLYTVTGSTQTKSLHQDIYIYTNGNVVILLLTSQSL
jgi:hypothetical protein